MKKFTVKDLLWILILLGFIAIVLFEPSREKFEYYTKHYPYLMGFIKTSILATMGELLAMRLKTGQYKAVGLIYRFIIWGLIGMSFVVVFRIFDAGVTSAIDAGLLPSLFNAFFISLFMNLIFAPTFMALHRITDGYIDLGNGKLSQILKVKVDDVINRIDWNNFIKFVVFKTIPIFWIPAHTITFLLAAEYRILMASFLSIALGIILSIAKRKKT